MLRAGAEVSVKPRQYLNLNVRAPTGLVWLEWLNGLLARAVQQPTSNRP